MTLSLTSDFETLAKTFDLDTNGSQASATIIFQLLLLKHGLRNAFAWIANNMTIEDDDWANCVIPSTVSDNYGGIRLKELIEVTKSFGFSLIKEKRKPAKMEFNHEMIKKRSEY